ncbi:hypothetical protein FPZ12_016155 [Amycolatopsis acidicola]|uniref:Uncharacterized protein n=1 Tax=Amycolatopsis acidicola TaxID=2596893 RepID=A0A5N0V6A1_9PSEU|nr:hypothetical protein [Amycolatopsis acidicola]KAA9160683.1 hypothetical protein FPZ12_016155 [Amycolatopsis acidicola]
MVDPLSFPALAGAALNQAFNFLFGRLASLLDKRGRGEQREDEVDCPAVLREEFTSLKPRADLVEGALPQLRELMGMLSTYDRNPDQLDIGDGELRSALGRLRTMLEQIYDQPLTFDGEAGRSEIHAELKAKTVSGEMVGMDAKRVRRGTVDVDVEQVRRGGSVIGVRADEIG